MEPLFKVDGIRHTDQALRMQRIGCEDVDETIRISHRQRLQQDRADNTEDRRGSGDAKRQREEGCSGAARVPAPLV